MTHAKSALALCVLLLGCAPIGPPGDDFDTDGADETSTGEGTSTGDADPWYPKLDVGPPDECELEAEPCKYSADCCGDLACISLDGELAFCMDLGG